MPNSGHVIFLTPDQKQKKGGQSQKQKVGESEKLLILLPHYNIIPCEQFIYYIL